MSNEHAKMIGMNETAQTILELTRQAAAPFGVHELSRATGIDIASISRFRRGLRGLSFDRVIILAEACGIRISVRGPSKPLKKPKHVATTEG